jgi:hypothetical protein
MSMPESELFVAFEQNLSQWLARAVEPPSESPPQRTQPAFSRMFEERLKRLQTYLDQAEHDAEQALALLTAEITALRQWLDALSAARARLVERTVRAAVN